MADTVKTTKIIALGYSYNDATTNGKDKIVYLKLPNPRANLNETTVRNAGQKLLDNKIFLTPTGNEFKADALITAYTEEVETTEFDIGVIG